jgi:putative DNA primase/helicase
MSDVVTLIEENLDALVLDPSDPLTSAELFLAAEYQQGGARLLHHHRGMFCHWNGAAYAEMDEAALRANLYQFLKRAKRNEKGKVKPFKPTTSKVNNVLDALKAASNLPAEIEPPAWIARPGPPPAELIACRNGLLHLLTGELMPPNPAFFGLNAVDFDYDPDALDAVNFESFLDDLWSDDRQSRDTLQELFGFALTTDTRQHKIFMIEGPKRSGKGTLARVLTALLNPANVCAPTLASLGTNFGLAPLIGKQLAIISDARLGGRADQHAIVERLLSISGEDTLTIDRKYREPWTGRLAVRFLILTNELPRFADASGALISRFVLLKLHESFYGREDLGLTDRLLTELPAILNWAIAGWRRLQDRRYFVQPTSALEALQELEDLASPISAFVREKCEVGPGIEVKIDELWREWKNWSEENGRKPSTKQTFGRDLSASVRTIRVRQHRLGDKVERFYAGIGLAR